ncbi:MAG: ABC transporter ATP-binding protein [Chloroflexi bacterium]|nr:ABC transporter ATP-binding protein [Chloroflexota bacterium]
MRNTLLLELKNLTTAFPTRRGLVQAVAGVSLSLRAGEILGIVGESGCGKSVTLLSILRLISSPGRIADGRVLFDGTDLLKLPEGEMRRIRGKDIAMIFQDPLSSLNPAFTVGDQIGESLRIHHSVAAARGLPWARTSPEKERVLQLMSEVGISAPMDRYHEYPHEFSGGMQQRALIAIALACEPKILLADEPTTSLDVTIQAQIIDLLLDVTIQAQIIDLLRRINQEHGTAIVLVTHNLDLAAEFCQRIAVMYAGRIVETGTTEEVIESPQHPYTRGLLTCIPRISAQRTRIEPIPGNVPDLASIPPGCAFADRCAQARPVCQEGAVPFFRRSPGRLVRCLAHHDYARAPEWAWSQTVDVA